jgi:hypothetical protein
MLCAGRQPDLALLEGEGMDVVARAS